MNESSFHRIFSLCAFRGAVFLGLGLLLAQPCAGAADGFDPTGSLAMARYDHTATLLEDGMVLVAGGRNGLASTEIFDPATGTWTVTDNLANGRHFHTATLLQNGMVLAVGGVSSVGMALTSAELYDPASGTWSTTGTLMDARQSHTATLLQNGMVLVAGGVSNTGYLASAEIYDPASGTWSATDSLATARYNHTATLLEDGMVLVAGGLDDALAALASVELYDPASGTWSATDSLATARRYHTATLLQDGMVLVAGGLAGGSFFDSAEVYDPASGTWSATGSLATARYGHSATVLEDGMVLVAGGANSSFTFKSAELYDPASGSWTDTGSLTDARSFHTATLLQNGGVLVAGGNGGPAGALASAEIYGAAISSPSSVVNISTRLAVGTGDNVLIGGFILIGDTAKTVLVRGIGPSLPVDGALEDTTLDLHGSTGLLASNDDWRETQEQEIIDTTIPPTDDRESAILATLDPGAYTAILSGKGGSTGNGLVEVYDLGTAAGMDNLAAQTAAQLANISTRGFVQTGDNVMIGGFIVTGESPVDVLVRAIGPALTDKGVAGALQDTTLDLHDVNGVLLASNDDWQSDQEEEIDNTNLAPTDPRESAILRSLSAGAYTAILRGKDETTGVALVEAYVLL